MIIVSCTSKLQYADVHSILNLFDVDTQLSVKDAALNICYTACGFCQDIKFCCVFFVVNSRVCPFSHSKLFLWMPHSLLAQQLFNVFCIPLHTFALHTFVTGVDIEIDTTQHESQMKTNLNNDVADSTKCVIGCYHQVNQNNETGNQISRYATLSLLYSALCHQQVATLRQP